MGARHEGRSSHFGCDVEITSSSNPLVRRFVKLRDGGAATHDSLFFVEGKQLVLMGLESGWQPDHILICRDLCSAGELEWALSLLSESTRVVYVSRGVATKISGRDMPCGLIASFHQRIVSLAEVVEPAIFFCSPQNSGNLGSVVRLAHAVGFRTVVTLGSSSSFWSYSAVRASMGSVFRVSLATATYEEFEDWVAQRNPRIYGLDSNSRLSIRDARPLAPYSVLFGNESRGIPAEVVRLLDASFIIPMAPDIDSLNVAVAAGIALYTLKFQEVPRMGELQ